MTFEISQAGHKIPPIKIVMSCQLQTKLYFSLSILFVKLLKLLILYMSFFIQLLVAGGGNCTGALWNLALAVSCPFCGREALLATNTPGSPRRDSLVLSSLSVLPCPDGSLNEGSSNSEYRSLTPVQ